MYEFILIVHVLYSCRDKITEAKEELARERSQSDYSGYGVSPSRSARSTPAPCENCQLLRDQTEKLKEMNKIFTDKIKKVRKEDKMNFDGLWHFYSRCRLQW